MYSKILIILFIAFIYNGFLHSQTNWVWQNPLPQGNDLNAVKFIDVNTGWAVGDKGTILKTINGGLNWSVQNSNVEVNLKNLIVFSENLSYVVGEYGVILKTTNGGNQWKLNLLSGNPVLLGITFNNNLTGWVCGSTTSDNGCIYKTTDGGLNWTLNYTSSITNKITKLIFWNENNGWAGGRGSYFQTTNGGNNWINHYSGFTDGNDFAFRDSLTGISVNYRYIFKTTNGGLNYNFTYSTPDTIYKSVHFTDQNTGYTAGSKGTILKTSDYGDNWFPLVSNTSQNLNSIFFNNAKGFSVGTTGIILNTTNSGNNWNSITKGNGLNYYYSFFINSETSWVSGTDGIFKTTNSGSNWNQVWDSISNSNLYPYPFFVNENDGWFIYSEISYDAAINNSDIISIFNNTQSDVEFDIYKTSNGGNDWEVAYQFPYVSSTRLFPKSIFFINENTGFISGERIRFLGPPIWVIHDGFIYKTTNGGENWSYTYLGSRMNHIYFVNENKGFAVGWESIFKTENAGNNWTEVPGIFNVIQYSKINFINENTGFLLGKYIYSPKTSKICKTTDFGSSWEDITLVEFKDMNSISFLKENEGWICGDKGQLYATSNNGNNWIKQLTPSNNNINSISFTSDNTGWVVGGNSMILKTESGINPVRVNSTIESGIMSFNLSQNYPNPFNPSTNLEFGISELGFVSLKVYDALGKEVATIVNEVLSPGNYNYQFSTVNYQLPSGVYFYKLESGGFVETKRMVLLK
ncbi:MAG: T9SS type A sorting domain-containing protein [Ignavibacteriae bacterium]|nr:T9SS type A sorting domain-containing protein [Ignavibacteriota bacterium]